MTLYRVRRIGLIVPNDGKCRSKSLHLQWSGVSTWSPVVQSLLRLSHLSQIPHFVLTRICPFYVSPYKGSYGRDAVLELRCGSLLVRRTRSFRSLLKTTFRFGKVDILAFSVCLRRRSLSSFNV